MIVVAGECLVDVIVGADGGTEIRPGGGPFNVARGLARLGRHCAFLGAVSDDRFGSMLRDELRADGVDERALVTTGAPTTLAVAELDGEGAATYRFYLDGTAAPLLAAAQVGAALTADVTALHAGTLALAVEPAGSSIEAAALALDRSVLLMLDPNCRPTAIADPAAYRARIARLVARADVVKVSADDLAFLAPGEPPHDAARGLVRAGARAVLLTDGPRSVHVLAADFAFEAPVPAARVVDTVGAGDAFGAGFLASWTERGLGPQALGDRDELARSVAFACEVAARTCERAGAMPPRLEELGGYS